jgi:hypothetical protein
VRGRSGVEDRVRAGLGWICMATNETKTISVDKRNRKEWINEMDTQETKNISVEILRINEIQKSG